MIVRTSGVMVLLLVTGCGPRPIPVMENGEVLSDRRAAVVASAREDGESERWRLTEARAAEGTAALATCAPAVCDAIARGEVMLGMTESQVLAATRTTVDAWEIRGSNGLRLMTARIGTPAPRDGVGELAYVSMQSGSVAGYTYREHQGFRTVTAPEDAALAGRSAARADALLLEGDEYAAAGRLDLALDRYDRADVIRPGNSETTLRIASTLDKQLRPIEAELQYRLFVHRLELEQIHARGEVAARIAEAIARAHERIVVLERR